MFVLLLLFVFVIVLVLLVDEVVFVVFDVVFEVLVVVERLVVVGAFKLLVDVVTLAFALSNAFSNTRAPAIHGTPMRSASLARLNIPFVNAIPHDCSTAGGA